MIHVGQDLKENMENIPACAKITLIMVLKCSVLGCDNIFVKGQASGFFRIPIIRENERDFSKKNVTEVADWYCLHSFRVL